MSRERAPAMSRMQGKIDAMKATVTRFNPKRRGEDDEAFSERVKKKFHQAVFALAKKEKRLFGGVNKYSKPHQGKQECARRVRQFAAGAIWNYDRDRHYMRRGF